MATYKVECPCCEIENEEASAQDVLRAAYVAACILEHEVRRSGTPAEVDDAQTTADKAEEAMDGLAECLGKAEELVRDAMKSKQKKGG